MKTETDKNDENDACPNKLIAHTYSNYWGNEAFKLHETTNESISSFF
jgi:hypothetical protein